MRIKYIYNHTLANWLIRRGIMPCGAGTGIRGDDYIQFSITNKLDSALNEWHTNKR